ncbi:hypothetical protein GEMRC1_007208 [Eukaryota sp. GEM-RC1]
MSESPSDSESVVSVPRDIEDSYDTDLSPLSITSAIEWFTTFLSWCFIPLKTTIPEIERRYGSTCGFFFSLGRSILGAIFLLGVNCGFLLYFHIQDLLKDNSPLFGTMDGIYPIILQPSSIYSERATHWSYVIIMGYCMTIIFAGLFTVFASRLMYRRKALEDSHTVLTPKFMELIFDFDWNANAQDQMIHQSIELMENCHISIQEESVRLVKLDEKRYGISKKLKIYRYAADVVFISFALVCAFGVRGLATVQSFLIEDQSDDDESILGMAINLLVSSAVAILNLLSPMIASIILKMYNEIDLNKRNSLRLLLMLVFRASLLTPLIFNVASDLEDEDDCNLNATSRNLTNLLIITLVLDSTIFTGVEVLKAGIIKLFGLHKDLSEEEKFNKRKQFDFHDLSVRLIYYFALTVLSLPFSPFNPILSFFIVYAFLRLFKFLLETFWRPPTDHYRKERSRFSFSLSLLMVLSFVGLLLLVFVSMEHTCGPFDGRPMDFNPLLHPMFWIPTTLLIFVWFRSSILGTAYECYQKQLVLKRKLQMRQ